jgi:hypothetical protein
MPAVKTASDDEGPSILGQVYQLIDRAMKEW